MTRQPYIIALALRDKLAKGEIETLIFRDRVDQRRNRRLSKLLDKLNAKEINR